MSAYDERYERALRLAAKAHASQKRKGTDIPYMTHPVHVARILERHGFGMDVIVAGLLHDVVEDCDVSIDDIRAELGERVATLVSAVTERKREGWRERRWEERKREAIEHLSRADTDTTALKAADALHNARTIAADLRLHGRQVWSRFKRGANETLWYYRSLSRVVRERLGGHPLADELATAVEDLAETNDQRGG